MENDKVKLLWDMNMHTDKVLEHSRPYVVVLEIETRTCKVIACQLDTRVIGKDHEKVNRF